MADDAAAEQGEARYRAATRTPKRWELRLYFALWTLLSLLGRLVFRIRIEGREHIPADRPYLLAPVHRSNIDFAIVALVDRRRLRYIAKDTLWKYRTLGKLWYALGAFPVRRGSADREALRTSVGVLAAGEPLVLFPEGTRQSGPVVEELFDGAVFVASRAGVPIVPVGIGGSERAMPKGAKMIRPVKLTLVVGPPVDPPAGERGRASRRDLQAATANLKVELQRLFDEAQRLAGG